MEKKHGQKRVNTKVIISELHRAFKLFNEQLFNGELPEPAILVAPRGNKKLTLGWCTVGKVWKNEVTEEERYEINLCAEALNRGIYPVMATLLHEMVHLHNLVFEIKDVSRGGTYHNMKFKKVAEEHGLIIEHAEKIGWSVTKLQGTTMDLIDKAGFDEVVFSFGRREMLSDEDKKRKKKKSSVRKYVCPRCGCIIRASKQVKVICGDCYEKDNLLMYFIEETEPEEDENGNPAITIEPTEYEPVEDGGAEAEGTEVNIPEEPTFENPMEYVCQECGCISTVERTDGATYICGECGSTNIVILGEMGADDEDKKETETDMQKEVPVLPITEEPTQLDDGAGNMVDVLQRKFEVERNEALSRLVGRLIKKKAPNKPETTEELGANEKRIAESIAKDGFVIGCYDKKVEELKYMALMKVIDNALLNEHTDVDVKIKGKAHIVEISTVGNEKDFAVYTVEEYAEKYGDNK